MNTKATAPQDSPPRLLIVGCGYLGIRVGCQAKTAGWSVMATSRTRLAELAGHGFQPVGLDWNDSRDLATIASLIKNDGIDRILIAVSYDRSSSVDRYASQVDGLARLLGVVKSASESNACALPDVCYISTTGVYHQTEGEWVDERSTTRPSRDGGRAHLLAEAKLRSVLGNSPWTVLRLSGIYGPGRVPRAADVRAGRPIASPRDGYLNLIHVEDAATAVIAAFTYSERRHANERQRLYAVSDDRPVVRQQFYDEIATQTNSPPPVFVDPAQDSGVRFRSETDKRVWNRQFKRDLLPSLRYPSYVDGLRSIL